MSCLDDDLAEKDLFLEDFYEFNTFDDTFDYFPLEGQEKRLSYAESDGDETPLHDAGANMEPHFTP